MDKLPGLIVVPLWGRKVLELQRIKQGKNTGIHIGMSFRQDHAGLYASMGLGAVLFILHFYDGRHWCSKHGCWFDEEKHPYHE